MNTNTDMDSADNGRRQRGSADLMLVLFAMITGGGVVFLLTAFGVIPHLQFGDNSIMVVLVVVGIVLASIGWMRIFKKTY
jgi:hypothetical protein